MRPVTEGRLLLAVDLGTSHLKLAVYDLDLRIAHTSVRPTRTASGRREGELDPQALWRAMGSQIVELGSRMDLQQIAAIGITGMAESGCLIGRDSQPLTPMLMWHDRRGIRQAAALRRRAGDTFARITGLRMTSVRSIAKWKWLVESGAPRGARWCGGPEWLALCLTGEWQTDSTLAARTGVFDVLKGEYSAALLRLAGAPKNLFPPAHSSPASVGTILPEIAQELRLSMSAQVVIAGHDDIASAFGAGGEMGDLVDSGGTAEGLIRIVAERPIPAETVKARLAMTRYYLPGMWALIAGAGSTGALMQRVSEMLGQGEEMLDKRASPPGDYPAGTIEVKLSKEGFPAAKIKPRAQRAQVWSAVLDLVCERVAQAASRLERLAGRPARMILIGGAARSRTLAERKSRRLGLPVVVRADIDAGTRGAAALAGKAHGLLRAGPSTDTGGGAPA